MKIIKYILPVILIGTILSGCEKNLLNTVPNDRVSTSVFWKTVQDATLGANAVYTYLPGTGIFNWDGLSDIAHTNQSFTVGAEIEMGQYNSQTSTIANQWSQNYDGIYAANSFLANVGKVNTTDTATINRLKAEVRVLRAYFYINLVMLYGNVPLITTPINVSQAQAMKQTSAAQIWTFIDQELTDAADELPLVQTDKGRVTKGAALALDARAMLYAGNYQKAANAAQDVMNLGVYSLYPSYKDLFSYSAEENSGVILEHEYLAGTNTNGVFAMMAPYSQNSSGSAIVPTENLVDAYEMTNGTAITDPGSGFDPYHPYKNRDPRLEYSIFVPGDTLPDGSIYKPLPGSGSRDEVGSTYNATSTGFNFKKYINASDLGDPGQCSINIILLRYAEVLLTYAEAKIELNQIDQSVYDAIDEVRARPDVNMPPIQDPETQAALITTVRHEREVELADEGLRFFDIRRWKTADSLMQGPIYGATYDDNGTLQTIVVTGVQRHFQSPRDYLWPIPYQETLLDKNLIQNPGW